MKTVSINDLQVEVKTNEVKNAVKAFNEIFDCMKTLQLGIQINNLEEFSKMINSPEAWIKNTLISGMEPQTIKVFGISLKTKPAKVLEMVELPDLTNLKDHCKKCSSQTHLLKYTNISSKGIHLKKDAIETIITEFSIFAKTSQAIAASEALETIVKAINQFNQIAIANEVGTINRYTIGTIVDLNSDEAKLSDQFLFQSGLFK